MDRKLSKQLSENFQQVDPYQLISILNKKIKSQSQSVQWYKKMYETAQYEKKLTLNQLKKKKEMIETLKLQWANEKQQKKDYELELQQLRTKLNKLQRSNFSFNFNNNSPYRPITIVNNTNLKESLACSPLSNHNLIKSKKSIPPTLKNIKINSKLFQKPLNSQMSSELKSNELQNFFSGPNLGPISRVLQEKNANHLKEQFIPCDVKFINGQKYSVPHSSQSLLNVSSQLPNQNGEDIISERPGQFFVEDFLVFGPDLSDLKKKREEDRNAQILTVKPRILYAGNHRASNQHVYTQLAMRCFPFDAIAKRQLIESYDELKDIIEYFPQPKISADCLILNLKGQVSSMATHNPCFRRSNLSEMEFIICLKVPDFILIAKDQRHYQRTEQQVWMVDKYYAIVSYFPFFDMHLNMMTKIHSLLLKEKLNKIHIEKEKFYTFDLKKNISELEKNQQIKSILQYFKTYVPQFEDVLFYKGHYYGTIPNEKQAEFYIAKMTAPIFMTNFCFEEMLLLLVAVFCEKSIAFISKNEGTATLCALFLIGIITPFPYSFSVLLNVDEQKICPFVFQYPFPMISTIKKTCENLHQIIMSYASARIEKKGIKQESQRMILVDIDTNSIFYQGHQTFQPLIFMGHPGQEFMQEYMKINPSFSKSFSFPKKMDARKQAQQFNKRQQQRNKIIEDIEQTIKSNTMKIPSFSMNEQIKKTLEMLLSYVKSYAVEGKELFEALEELQSGKYQTVLKKYLLERHPTKGELLQKIVHSQYYADYLNMLADQ